MNVIPRSQWGARAPTGRTPLVRSQVTHLFLHHAAGRYPSGAQAMRSIQAFHMDGRGWTDFAYSYGVSVDGEMFEGRGWGAQGGHTRGWNTRSVAICYLGFGEEPPSEKVKRAILWLADDADRHYGRNLVRRGHRDVGATVCPGDAMYAWWSKSPVAPSVLEPSPVVVTPATVEVSAGATTEPPEGEGWANRPSWVPKADWQRLIDWTRRAK